MSVLGSSVAASRTSDIADKMDRTASRPVLRASSGRFVPTLPAARGAETRSPRCALVIALTLMGDRLIAAAPASSPSST
jgi:hypothetical protein